MLRALVRPGQFFRGFAESAAAQVPGYRLTRSQTEGVGEMEAANARNPGDVIRIQVPSEEGFDILRASPLSARRHRLQPAVKEKELRGTILNGAKRRSADRVEAEAVNKWLFRIDRR